MMDTFLSTLHFQNRNWNKKSTLYFTHCVKVGDESYHPSSEKTAKKKLNLQK